MDKNTFIILKADLNAQIQLMASIEQKLQARCENLESDDIIRLESIAYQIHNLYNATKDLLKIVATYFENHITETSRWHSLLLHRMSQEIPEIRPALISQETYNILDSLRGFRHFFRHAYNTAIEYNQLKSNLDKALNLSSNLKKDLKIFLEQITTN
ncbi:ribonuclease toxin HepT-like protein [Geminocystis herdmanii]|uniref:ribonuclease toxin HepT-like protein n=1 Tax=Geminocystis herdmanii TaxID=669359 RepID=UPI000373366C|nr:hypothetical protein [Geminocystis herdmanii]